MKKFQSYLREVGITTEALQKRVRDVYAIHMELNQTEPNDLLVEEYIDLEGARLYSGLSFFFGNGLIFCANDFISNDEFAVSSLSRIGVARFRSNNYNFSKANDKSAVTLELRLYDDPDRGFSFKATKGNCDHLVKMYHMYMESFIHR